MSPDRQENTFFAHSVHELAEIGLRLGLPEGSTDPVAPDQLLIVRAHRAFREWVRQDFVAGIGSVEDQVDALSDFVHNVRANDLLKPFSAIHAASSLILTDDVLLEGLYEDELRKMLISTVLAELSGNKQDPPGKGPRNLRLYFANLVYLNGEIDEDEFNDLVEQIQREYAQDDTEFVKTVLEFARKIETPASPTLPQGAKK